MCYAMPQLLIDGRWFSWFESWEFYAPDIWTLKMVLEAADARGYASDDAEEAAVCLPLRAQGAEAEVAELKRQYGLWRTACAPQLRCRVRVVFLLGRCCMSSLCCALRLRSFLLLLLLLFLLGPPARNGSIGCSSVEPPEVRVHHRGVGVAIQVLEDCSAGHMVLEHQPRADCRWPARVFAVRGEHGRRRVATGGSGHRRALLRPRCAVRGARDIGGFIVWLN